MYIRVYNMYCVGGDVSQVCPAVQLRENFARACFEALLQFSFMHDKDSSLGQCETTQSHTHTQYDCE